MHSPPPQYRPARDVVQAQRHRIWARNAVDLSIYDRAILGELELHADGDGVTWVSVPTIAAESGASERTTWRVMSRLRRLGRVTSRIEVTPRGRRNTWRVVFNASSAPAVANDDGGADVQAHRTSPPARGSCPSGRTRRASLAGPPPSALSSDRDQLIDPPLSPPSRGSEPQPSVQPAAVQGETGVKGSSKTSDSNGTTPTAAHDAVWSVLAYFMTVLHPESTGPVDTADRRRIVVARLQEFGGDTATLRDAVDGAKLSEWHASRDIGFRADVIFRNADTIEQLAQLARRKRRQDASAARGGPRPLPPAAKAAIPAPPRSAACPPASREQAPRAAPPPRVPAPPDCRR